MWDCLFDLTVTKLQGGWGLPPNARQMPGPTVIRWNEDEKSKALKWRGKFITHCKLSWNKSDLCAGFWLGYWHSTALLKIFLKRDSSFIFSSSLVSTSGTSYLIACMSEVCEIKLICPLKLEQVLISQLIPQESGSGDARQGTGKREMAQGKCIWKSGIVTNQSDAISKGAPCKQSHDKNYKHSEVLVYSDKPWWLTPQAILQHSVTSCISSLKG